MKLVYFQSNVGKPQFKIAFWPAEVEELDRNWNFQRASYGDLAAKFGDRFIDAQKRASDALTELHRTAKYR